MNGFARTGNAPPAKGRGAGSAVTTRRGRAFGAPVPAHRHKRPPRQQPVQAEAAAALEEYPIPVFTAVVGPRVAVAESAASGSTVVELEPTGQAAKEINAVADERLALEGEEG